jgi:SAM-dependent methyltransferase
METKVYALMNQRESTFWWHVGMQKIIDAQLQKYAPKKKDSRILDAGCGTGGVFNLLAKYGRVYGVDQSIEAVGFAKSKHIAQEVLLSSISDLPYHDNSFDIIVCLDVLYHARSGHEHLDPVSEFYRVLRPEGTLITREPAYNWLRGHQDKIVWTKRRYKKYELVSKLSKTGFEIKKASYVNSFLLPLAVLKRFSETFYTPPNMIEHTFHTNGFLNFIFKQILYLEAKLIAHMNFPFGLSILCVGKKNK